MSLASQHDCGQSDPTLPARLEVRVRDVLAAEDNGRRPAVPIGKDGRFLSRGLLAGTYEVEVRIDGRTAITVAGIEVPEGVIVEPPELQDLVVGGEFFLATVEVRNPDGVALPGASVTFRAAVDGAPAEAGRRGGGGIERTGPDGRVQRVLRHGDRVQITVAHDDYQRQTFEDAAFPLSVTLRKGTTLVVRLPAPLPDLPGIGAARWILTGQGGQEGPQAFFGRGGGPVATTRAEAGASELVFENVPPGTWRLRLLGGRGNGGGGGFGAPAIEIAELTLPANVDRHEARPAIDGATFRARLEEAFPGR